MSDKEKQLLKKNEKLRRRIKELENGCEYLEQEILMMRAV